MILMIEHLLPDYSLFLFRLVFHLIGITNIKYISAQLAQNKLLLILDYTTISL